jgi:hypothetical protein
MISAADALESFASAPGRAGRPRSWRRYRRLGQQAGRVEPVFVLSTGRTGAALLTELLLLADGVDVHHTPRPELVRVSRRAYEEIGGNLDLFVEVFKTAREELLLQSVRRGRRYVETNNRVTFFAPAAAVEFPDAKFIHLTRDPATFVRSGLRRNWYSGTHHHDIGRIVPSATTRPSRSGAAGTVSRGSPGCGTRRTASSPTSWQRCRKAASSSRGRRTSSPTSAPPARSSRSAACGRRPTA